MKIECLSLFLLLLDAQAKDVFTIRFIKQYIENENKPTDLICDNLGWDKNAYKDLVKELFSSSVRTSTLHKSSISKVDVRSLFLIDLETSDLDVLQNITSHFAAPYRWLVLSDVTNEGSSALWHLPLRLDTDLVLAERDGYNINMIELYRTTPSGPTYSQRRGHYNGTLYDVRVRRELYRRRRDVMGHELVMSNVFQESNSTMYHLPREDRLELQYDSAPKMSWAVGRLAFEMVNATPRCTFHTRYGYKRNGSWTGMVKDLIDGKAITGTVLFLNMDRLEVVEYTDAITPLQLRFIFRQLPLADVSNIFTLPFSLNVWIAITVCAFISILALYLNGKWETHSEEATAEDSKITDAMLITVSAISIQGSSISPSSYSGRMILWLVFLSMMLIYTAYSANIVALLQAPSNAIRTFDQLKKSKLVLGAENLDYHNFIFRKDKKIHERILPEHGKKQLFSLEESARKIRKEPYAIHCAINSMYRRIEKTFLERDKCDLTEIDYLNTFEPCAPVLKYNPYVELLKVSFKRIRETGIMSALQKRYIMPKPRCSGQVSSFSSIGLQNIRPLLLLNLMGVAAAVGILVVEIVVHRLSPRLRSNDVVEI